MKLFGSMLTTGAIAGTIWFLVAHQPTIAKSTLLSDITYPVEKKINLSTTSEKETLYLHATTRRIPLSSISNLWSDFEKNNASKYYEKVFVLYQDINDDFTEAKVTIGYPAKTNSKNTTLIELPITKTKQFLLEKGKYQEAELNNAWSQIDFTKSVAAVVEIHYFGSNGRQDSSQLTVYYR